MATKYAPRHSTGLVARRELPDISMRKIAAGCVLGATITATGGVAIALAGPSGPPTTLTSNPDKWIHMDDDNSDITYDQSGEWIEPPAEGDDLEAFEAARTAGFPGFIPDEGGSKGILDPATDENDAPADPKNDPDESLVIPHDWSGVADCESGGDWAYYEEGHPYFGGLQFSQSTWEYFGGLEFATRADLATPYQQQVVAERTLNGQGIGAWPECGQYLQDAKDPAANGNGVGDTNATAPAPAESIGQQAVNVAMMFIGSDEHPERYTPYVWGGSSPVDGGFDCSGIVVYAYGQIGIPVPRTTWDQINYGWSVSFDELQPGDVIITSGGGHEVMYIGDGMVLQFQQPGTDGMLTPLSDILNYYGPIDARRFA